MSSLREQKPEEIFKRQEKAKKKRRKRRSSSSKQSEFGESLASCSDKEWDRADPAYNSELINVKKKTNKVTVFASPRAKTIERTIIKTEALSQELDENADAIGRMASAIAHIFLSDKTVPSVDVAIDLREVPQSTDVPLDPKTA